jgi:4-amino-4-deoxy-L-arabinose transferase-like glycosyltransferase
MQPHHIATWLQRGSIAASLVEHSVVTPRPDVAHVIPRLPAAISLGRTTPRRVDVAVCCVLLFCLALLVRTQGLDQYVTVDEDLTLGRTGNFVEALADGRWQRTYQIGHPEVTVMWVAAAALGPSRARDFAGSVSVESRVPDSRVVVERPEFMTALAQARFGMAVANSLILITAALLIWRLAGPLAGLLGGTMLALEPFVVAHGQILRADALLAGLMLVAVLAATAYWLAGAGRWALWLAIVATGLGLLTKTPALLGLPIIAGIALISWHIRGQSPFRSVAAWISGSAALYVLLWPAMWVRPAGTIQRVAEYTAAKGGSPMDAGSYLFGQAVADPGPLFYPMAFLLRVSPVALLGLLTLLRWRPVRQQWLVAVLLAAALIFGVVISFAPKKADRYMLPLIPFLIAAAAVGTAELARRRRVAEQVLVLGAIVVVQVASLLAVWPYPLAYYNPLLGGGAVASRTILVGSGEGLDVVARALNRLPGAASSTAAVFYPDALAAQFTGRVVPLDAYDVADFAVLYVSAEQRQLTAPPLADSLADQQPEMEVLLNGVRYARVYRLPRPEFADGIVLDGIELTDRFVTRGQPVALNLRWGVRTPNTRSLRSRVVLLDGSGRTVGQSTGLTQPGPLPERFAERHSMRAPDRIGRYTVAVLLYDEPSGEALPIVHRPPGLPESETSLIFRSLWMRVQ